jgi:hypothetical protein
MPRYRPFLLLCVAPLVAVTACAQRSTDAQPSILQAKGDSVRVQFLDATSAQPIADTEIELWSDNGIRCVQAPCPTNGKQWKGKSDAYGRVVIPKSALNTSTTLKSDSYHGDLIQDASPGAAGSWTIELFAEKAGDPGPHPLKLIDARTHKAIANTPVRIETRNAHGPSSAESVSSNALGYILVPFQIVVKGAENSWVVAPGYRDAHIDFAWTRRRMSLTPR